MNQEDDAGYKLLFSAPEMVRDLVMGFIPDEWLHGLDYGTLEKLPGTYVTDDYRHRADDVVWRLKADREWVYLYILLEFQSTVDTYMAVRMMVYVGLLYQDLIRRNQVLPGKRLPPVLPIVLYNGDEPWHAATDIAELIPKAPGVVSDLLPRLKYLLIAENAYRNADLAPMKNLMAAVIRFERPHDAQSLLDLIDELQDWLQKKPELKRLFAIWIRAVLLRRGKHHLVLPKVNDLKELKMGLAERLDTWEREFEERGLQKGLQKGEALALQRLLAKRFGILPPEITAKIAAASADQIEIWLDRLLEAESLESLFL